MASSQLDAFAEQARAFCRWATGEDGVEMSAVLAVRCVSSLYTAALDLPIAQLEQAGFENRSGKGSHRNYVHPRLSKPITISGKLGDDAKQYQIRAVTNAIAELDK